MIRPSTLYNSDMDTCSQTQTVCGTCGAGASTLDDATRGQNVLTDQGQFTGHIIHYGSYMTQVTGEFVTAVHAVRHKNMESATETCIQPQKPAVRYRDLQSATEACSQPQ